jgi:hypothetical protein
MANGCFECWQNVGSATEEPTKWNSNKTGGGNASTGPQTCFRDINAHSGSYCAKVQSVNYFVVVNGSLTTGKVEAPSLNKADGYIRTIPTDSLYNMPFTGRPDSLVFWLKYTKAGSDKPKVEARLHVGVAHAPEVPNNGNHPDNSANVIARALFLGNNADINTWTRISVPFVYVDGRTPEYILITMTPSHEQNGGTAGSTMYVDDFDVIYNPTIATGTVNTGPLYVSASTGAPVSVPFTLTGIYSGSNTVTAQLSNASGSFASPVNIGSVTTTTSGTINATIPAGTLSGTGYRIRVVSSSPALTANDNGSNISVVLVNASVSPSSTQNILAGVNGIALTVAETPSATSRTWKYSTTSGSGYVPFNPSETSSSYTPNFQTNGTYYIVCESQIQGLTAVSNEVEVTVSSVTLITDSVSETIFDFSPNSPSGNVDVYFSTSAAFNNGNTFTAQLSDASGSFGNPLTIGSISATGSGTINGVIPNNVASGSGYRIRVTGSDPVVAGSDNGNDIFINQYENSISPANTQMILVNASGNFLTVLESQNSISREWLYSTISGSNYTSFSPAETLPSYTPYFTQAGNYYVVCASTNQYNDEVVSNEVEIQVSIGTGIDGKADIVNIWNIHQNLKVDLTNSVMKNPEISIIDFSGKVLYHKTLISSDLNNINLNLSSGIFIVKISDGNNLLTKRIAIFNN